MFEQILDAGWGLLHSEAIVFHLFGFTSYTEKL